MIKSLSKLAGGCLLRVAKYIRAYNENHMDHLFKCRCLSHHRNGASILRLEVLKDIFDVDPVL